MAMFELFPRCFGYRSSIYLFCFSLTLPIGVDNMTKTFAFRILIFAAVVVLAGFIPPRNEKAAEKVQWMTFEEAVEKNKTAPRKVFIDVYTDWCGWCKRMDANTFNNPVVAKYLNETYYNVKLDAEGKDPIEFDGHTFEWVDTGRNGIHTLAYALLDKKMSYPTVVFLNEEFQLLQRLPGYQQAPFFDKVIKFYGEDVHKEKPWDEFVKEYESPLE